MLVTVPASSANLGAGFDSLGMALTLHAEAGVGEPIDGAHVVDEHHPAYIAFRQHGGDGELWVKSPIPMGRGMGYSGAVRVCGLVAAHTQRHGADPEMLEAALAELLLVAAELEGHADNVAASLYGGVVATAGGRAVRVPMPFDPAMVMWVPGFVTSTDESRATLPSEVSMADAVFNIGRAALLVASLATGDLTALETATRDRLHSDRRLASSPSTRDAVDAMRRSGALATWLSGSGPTAAAFVERGTSAPVLASVAGNGTARVLTIDTTGARAE